MNTQTTRVETPIGTLEVHLLDATRAYVSTVSGDAVEVRGKHYTVSARFALVDGAWARVHEGYGLDPVAHRDWTNYSKRTAAPTIAAKAIAHALEALESVVRTDPGALHAAAVARAQ